MTQTILIVDDDEMTRRILRLFLMRHEYAVIEAENGQDALNLIEENCPNLVIIDVLMPVMDGFTTVRHIRSILGYVDLPVLFLTSRADMEAELEGLEVGAQHFLNKPIKLAELVDTVSRLMAETKFQWQLEKA